MQASRIESLWHRTEAKPKSGETLDKRCTSISIPANRTRSDVPWIPQRLDVKAAAAAAAEADVDEPPTQYTGVTAV